MFKALPLYRLDFLQTTTVWTKLESRIRRARQRLLEPEFATGQEREQPFARHSRFGLRVVCPTTVAPQIQFTHLPAKPVQVEILEPGSTHPCFHFASNAVLFQRVPVCIDHAVRIATFSNDYKCWSIMSENRH